MKDLQILWSAFKYHWRRFVKLFKSKGLIMDDQGNYYTDGNYQMVLSWRAFRSWQNKRIKRGLPSVNIRQRNFTWYLNGEEWDGNPKCLGRVL